MTPDNPLSPYERAAHALGDVMDGLWDRAFPADAGRACAPSGLSRDASQAEPLVPNAENDK